MDLQKKRQPQRKVDENGKVLKRQKNSNCQCPYYKQSNIEDLRDFALNGVHDIEDLVQAGNEITACPYYASRKAAEDAEVVLGNAIYFYERILATFPNIYLCNNFC